MSFRYPGAGHQNVLTEVDFTIPEGKVTALVGASGSGKTTLLKLLLALHPPGQGRILIGDTPLSIFDARAWRERVGVVMQDGYIFSGSIAENIACGTHAPDELRLHQVVDRASLGEFIRAAPLGLATRIGEEHGSDRPGPDRPGPSGRSWICIGPDRSRTVPDRRTAVRGPV